ncbi:MAG: hypothetical protein ABIB79_04070 [archaeon]
METIRRADLTKRLNEKLNQDNGIAIFPSKEGKNTGRIAYFFINNEVFWKVLETDYLSEFYYSWQSQYKDRTPRFHNLSDKNLDMFYWVDKNREEILNNRYNLDEVLFFGDSQNPTKDDFDQPMIIFPDQFDNVYTAPRDLFMKKFGPEPTFWSKKCKDLEFYKVEGENET